MSDSSTPNFLLRQKIEDFSVWFFPIVDRFPQREKWALCTEIKRCVYRMMQAVIRAQKSKNKIAHLFELDAELEMLRFLVRQAHGFRYLSNRRLQLVTERITEIGKIVGGMVRRAKGA